MNLTITDENLKFFELLYTVCCVLINGSFTHIMTFTAIIVSVIAIVLAYFIGSIPTSYLVGRYIKGVDIRTIGSRNAGTMNTIYQIGFFWGMLVLFVDIAKGSLAVYVSVLLGTPLWVNLLAGVFAVLGHTFPVFLKANSGKWSL